MEKDRQLDQLGLPPMELAESSNEQKSRCLYRCMYPALQKVCILLTLITFSAGIYVLLLKLLELTDNNNHSTEIIVLTGLRETPNITLRRNDMDIFFQLRNYTDIHTNRRKRSVHNEPQTNKRILDNLNNKEQDRIRKIIYQHHVLCHEKNHKENCAKLFNELHTIINSNEAVSPKDDINAKIDVEKVPLDHNVNPRAEPKPRNVRSQNLTDACLIAKLLKQSCPHAQEIYPPTNGKPIFDHQNMHHMRYFQPPMPLYMQSREIETHGQKLHPQDINILLNLFQSVPKPDINKSSQLECAPMTFACDNNEECVEEKLRCDGNVDCSDASDEIRCSCQSRVDKSRLCDGYFDCPFGEDEMGCFGCSENTFSCGKSDLSSQSACFTKEQRCDGVGDCSNHKDEIECNMLAPILHEKPLFAISNTEGYLHRNFKGDWYAVCQNPYMWAHDACRRETGLLIRPPIIQYVPIDPLHKMTYLNTGQGGYVQTSDTCFNSSAVYVTCSDFLCGTRVHTTSQLLRENIAVENLFGRNKRFLIPGYPFHPYHRMFFGNRMKRDTAGSNKSDITKSDEEKNRSMEGRVVGGKPSQPAAWPWVVAIYRDGMFHCGGVILTQSWVVSAAHCMHKFWDHYYEIQVGMLRRLSFSPQEHNHRVTHVIVNHHYNEEDMRGDLSLLKVEPDILFSRWVRPICLPGPNTAGPDWSSGPTPNTVCTTVGWGATVEHGPDPDHMREVEVPIWDNCKHREDREGKEICAGFFEGGKDACQGDSGGPLLCRNPLNFQQWYLAGIVSHGDGCARKNEPGVYTRVSLFVNWIKYHTSSKSLPQVQPKQNCPGFKCRFGIPKCLPDIRKCDKIVDCLDAQDEIDCNFKRSTNNMIFSNMVNTTESDKKSEKSSRHVQSSLFTSVKPTTFKDETIETLEDLITSTTKMTNTDKTNSIHEITHHNIENNEQSQSTLPQFSTMNETPEFQHASTIEISLTKSFEDFSSIENESVTSDPLNVTNSDTSETIPIAEQSLTVLFEPEALESRSSVTGNDVSTETQDKLTSNGIQKSSTATESTLPSTLFSLINEQPSLSTTQPNRGDGVPNEGTDIGNGNSVTESEITTESINIEENESNPLIIELLPNISSNTPQPDNSLVDGDTTVRENKTIENNDSTTTERLLPKNLPDIEDKSNLIHRIEDIVFSEIQPASIRRKHLVPNEFECRRIYQIISYSQHCDHKADCEDGTDELDCACTDYLTTFDEKLICDGVFDCADGQDELDCFNCPENRFLCHRSELCIPWKYVCDGNPQCPMGEDELNCFALTNGRDIIYNIDGKPQTNLEGYITKRNKNDWQIVCEESLTIRQQEVSANNICHYLGFSSANRYLVRYINVKEENILRPELNEIKRLKRGINKTVPVYFTYINANNDTETNIVIKEPQVLKEECIPNITKTCQSLFVFCDRSLFTNFDMSQNLIISRAAKSREESTSYLFPWIAKVFVEGEYKCTGVLIDLAWVLISDSCLWDSSPTQNFISVILGSHRTLQSTNGLYEQIIKVDAKKDFYRGRAILLHLKKSAEYSTMVKPMKIPFSNFHTNNNKVCVAIGQDNNNNTISIFVNETSKNCNLSNRCFVRQVENKICPTGIESHRQWSGLISCHSEQGWYPASSFVESRGECGLGERIVSTDIENLRYDITKYYYSENERRIKSQEVTDDDVCEGVRCSRGRCVSLRELCDGVNNCEDGIDESENSCKIKKLVCGKDLYHRGCECSLGQMKCKNGKCISKELFRDGNDDCGDETDEPNRTSCSDYLARVKPSRLCDGVLHCQDRSDEDPMFCKCFSKHVFKCDKSSQSENCVSPDMVCDGVRDCPNGEDERVCIGLNSKGTQYGTGQVIVCSHGVWRSKCYPTQNHTKSELEAICLELGFFGGHAKEIKDEKYLVDSYNNIHLEPFSNVILNNQTTIRMRNTDGPIAKPVFDENLKNCYPVLIECL